MFFPFIFILLLALLILPNNALGNTKELKRSTNTSENLEISSHFYTGQNITLEGKKIIDGSISIGKAITSRTQLNNYFLKNVFSTKYKLPITNDLVIDSTSNIINSAFSRPGVYPIHIFEKEKQIFSTIISVLPKDFKTNLYTSYTVILDPKIIQNEELENSNLLSITQISNFKKTENYFSQYIFDNNFPLGSLTHSKELSKYINLDAQLLNFETCPKDFSNINMINSNSLTNYTSKFSSQPLQMVDNKNILPIDENMNGILKQNIPDEKKYSFIIAATTIASLESPSQTRTFNFYENIKNENSLKNAIKISTELSKNSVTNLLTNLNIEDTLSNLNQNSKILKSKCQNISTTHKLISEKNILKKINYSKKVSKDFNLNYNKLIQNEFLSLNKKFIVNKKIVNTVLTKLDVALPKSIRSTGDSLKLPVSVSNKSDKEIKIKLFINSKLAYSQQKNIFFTLKPNSVKSIELEITSKSGGTHNIDVVVSTPNNLFQKKYSTTIRSQSIKQTGLVAMILLMIVLLLWWITNYRKHKNDNTK